MERATGTRFGPHRLAILVVVLAALAGCEEGFGLQEAPEEEAAIEDADNTNRFELFPEAAPTNQRDVEAPDVFQVTEAGLWDGRPSLGGVWVAHPDVTQPERVLIKNTSNNKTVTGALFRRERSLPGPALQVSSSAAEQLGMLAGAPTKVQVVALRREAIEQPPAPVEAEPTEDGDAAEDTETTTETAEAEAPEQPVKRKWWQKKPSDETNAGAAVVAGAAAGAAVASSENEATPAEDQTVEVATADPQAAEQSSTKRKWWQKKPTNEASAAATGAAVATTTDTEVAAPDAQTAALADPEVTPPTENTGKRKWWQKKNPDEITQTPLDPIAGAAAAIEASEPTAAPAVAATSASATGGLSKPYVQAGTFSVETNAKSAAEKIRRNGMNAEVFELKSEDKSIWRVLVGPVATRTERRALLNDVKDLGFTDAFTAKN
ncbi:SPOR domain-containing protein [uncultured Ruegeria sp.]|uniref:SPOR domain-containing protein n=1 Tax=uncultured Ruegeria sp. TaxID=259304 RepID=UPI0026334ADC|nr:SPOR domain-containing protein [uncultured Ruegeria sp.]